MEKSENPKVSVIIPSFNGAGKILSCLEALRCQTFTGFETIVVIDGSTDNTLDLLRNTDLRLQNFTIHYQENKGRAVVRNTGAMLAKGDLLIFIDDDIRLHKDAIKLHSEFHNKTCGVNALVGATPEDVNRIKTDFQLFRYSLSRRWLDNLGNSLVQLTYPYISAANFSISKNVFLKTGGFDTRLRDAEDYELAMRLIESGIKIYYHPEIVGWHDDYVTCSRYISRQKQYREAHKELAGLFPEKMSGNDRKPVFHGLKKLFFGSRNWVKWIDNETILLRILPSSLRYKLYDWVVTTQALS
jgi:glycosyltransferase involved in cell wall biosynthesis